MKISSFESGKNIDLVQQAIRDALAKVEADLGIRISVPRAATYEADGSGFTMKTISVMIESDNPYMEGVSVDIVRELNRHSDTNGKLLHVFEYMGKKCVIVGRKSAKILFKPFGEPKGPIRVWNIKMSDYTPSADAFKAALAKSKSMDV